MPCARPATGGFGRGLALVAAVLHALLLASMVLPDPAQRDAQKLTQGSRECVTDLPADFTTSFAADAGTEATAGFTSRSRSEPRPPQ
ncbi:hypothetical protein TspCOW1_18270 [Thiohalobacter sp. COW1]|uniref:Aspartyl/asparaginyl-tRNA synthetases n=1 Tax=Thiohalobacter thiocyanaticus TaxID=585455 RepID=A0A1Z4VNR2_9GAMM|nr:aspartyl/asparaginyl-tRNA synthetases [Thiohalobacter thiocyanaticus]BCO31724.1 hypothetical protein TspCOW1_18270 [Thiohalobacter sp. COW1]